MNERITATSRETTMDVTNWLDRIDDQVIDELSYDEKVELASLYIEVEQIHQQLTALAQYVISREFEVESPRLQNNLRTKLARIDELLTGYPQTGSASSAIAHRGNYPSKADGHFKIEGRIRYFDRHALDIFRGEENAFGDAALTMDQIEYYTHRDPIYTTIDSPIVAGHVWRNSDPTDKKLYSYILGLRTANPKGKTIFEQFLPPESDYIDGIWVDPELRGAHLGSDLTSFFLAHSDRRSVYASVKSYNFDMMYLLSRMGEDYRDPRYQDGPNAGRSHAIELLYWNNYFKDTADGDRVMTVYDPGIFIPDSIATIREGDVVTPQEVQDCLPNEEEGYPGKDRIAIRNGPTYNSAFRPQTYRVDNAVAMLLNNGYIGIPLGDYRLYVRIDSLPPRTARNIRRQQAIVDRPRQMDYALAA